MIRAIAGTRRTARDAAQLSVAVQRNTSAPLTTVGSRARPLWVVRLGGRIDAIGGEATGPSPRKAE